MKVSEHVSYTEVTKSNTAIRKGIENIPSGEQMENIKLLCENIFEPLRKHVGGPIAINSLFRSPRLNVAIGGSASSQHCANNGAAMDIDDTYGSMSNADMFEFIKDKLDFDQLIWEFGTDENPDWVHVSYKTRGNRKQILKCSKVKGRTVYSIYS
jgi:zinc D-Ala-D-Ala carboxypeptidase